MVHWEWQTQKKSRNDGTDSSSEIHAYNCTVNIHVKGERPPPKAQSPMAHFTEAKSYSVEQAFYEFRFRALVYVSSQNK